MQNPIVGVRFNGPNESYKDDVLFNTGAVWNIGDVVNLSFTPLAKRFLAFSPTFEQVEVDLDADTFVWCANKTTEDVAPNYNLQAMDADRLVYLARFEFDRVVQTEGKSDDQIRSEVRTLMVLNSLDLAEDDANSNVARKIGRDELCAILGLDTLAPVDAPIVPIAPVSVDSTVTSQPELNIDGMSKAELVELALIKFGVKLDKRSSLKVLAERVRSLLENMPPLEVPPANPSGNVDADLNSLPVDGDLHQIIDTPIQSADQTAETTETPA